MSYFTLYPRDAQGNLLLPHTEGLYITVIGRGPTGSATFLASVEHELDDGSFNVSDAIVPIFRGAEMLSRRPAMRLHVDRFAGGWC